MFKAIKLNLSDRSQVQNYVDSGSPEDNILAYTVRSDTNPRGGLHSDHVTRIAKGIKDTQRVAGNNKVIFVYPANSATAALKPSERKNKGSSGLAEVFEIDGIDNAGIPTIKGGGQANNFCTEAEIKHYIAQLYALAAQGHQLVFPMFGDKHGFGGGVSPEFINSDQYKFIQRELNALIIFLDKCAGQSAERIAILAAELEDEEYKAAVQEGILQQGKTPDAVFKAFTPRPAVNTGNAKEFTQDKIREIRTKCQEFNYELKPKDPSKQDKFIVTTNGAAKTELMTIEPNVVTAIKKVNNEDFYVNLLKIAVANNTPKGGPLCMYAPPGEVEKIQRAAKRASSELGGAQVINVVENYEEFERYKTAVKTGRPAPAPTSLRITPNPRPSATPNLEEVLANDTYKDSRVVETLLLGKSQKGNRADNNLSNLQITNSHTYKINVGPEGWKIDIDVYGEDARARIPATIQAVSEELTRTFNLTAADFKSDATSITITPTGLQKLKALRANSPALSVACAHLDCAEILQGNNVSSKNALLHEIITGQNQVFDIHHREDGTVEVYSKLLKHNRSEYFQDYLLDAAGASINTLLGLNDRNGAARHSMSMKNPESAAITMSAEQFAALQLKVQPPASRLTR